MQPLPSAYRLIPLGPNICSDAAATRLADWILGAVSIEYLRRLRYTYDAVDRMVVLLSLRRHGNMLVFHAVSTSARLIAIFDDTLDEASALVGGDWSRDGCALPYRPSVARIGTWIPYGLSSRTSPDWHCLLASEHRFESPLACARAGDILLLLGKVANGRPPRFSLPAIVSDDRRERLLLRELALAGRRKGIDPLLARMRIDGARPYEWDVVAEPAAHAATASARREDGGGIGA